MLNPYPLHGLEGKEHLARLGFKQFFWSLPKKNQADQNMKRTLKQYVFLDRKINIG